MSEHRVETTIKKDGTLTLTDLPFKEGESVEVIIFTHPSESAKQYEYPLRGKPIQYKNPTEPVAENDWEASQ